MEANNYNDFEKKLVCEDGWKGNNSKEEDDTEFIVFWHKSKKKMGTKDGLAMPQQ